MMKVERNITVNLKPEEVEDIIKKYLLSNEKINIDNVHFETATKYYSQMDEHGSTEFSGARCEGVLDNED